MHSILYNNAKRNSDFTNVKNYILNRNSITISNDVFIFSASLYSPLSIRGDVSRMTDRGVK